MTESLGYLRNIITLHYFQATVYFVESKWRRIKFFIEKETFAQYLTSFYLISLHRKLYFCYL